jgi:hypothetical protein
LGNFSPSATVKEHVTTTRPEDVSRPPVADGRAVQVWLIAVQAAVVVLTALALWWARVPVRIGDTEIERLMPPARMHQALIGVLALSAALVAVVPAWRRRTPAALVGAVMLATACQLSVADRVNATAFLDTETHPWLHDAKVPTLLVPLLIVAAVLAIWGLVVRGGLLDTSRFGIAALVAGAFIVLASLIGYAFLSNWYGIEGYQLLETLAVGLLYPLALWLGALGSRATGRWNFLPGALAIVGFAFLVFWRIH